MTMTFGSLFSGIGGIDLGLERAGMRCLWQVEIDDYARRVLAKHWSDVARYRDVRECGAPNLAPVDVIAGGFPCQDISSAGKRAGIDGARSGLWSEMARVVGELRPRYVLVENVAALLGRGLGRVLGDLAALGYDAEWECLPAASFGAPHIRDRVFILAYPGGSGRQQDARGAHGNEGPHEGRASLQTHESSGCSQGYRAGTLADSTGSRCTEGLCEESGAIRNEARREEPQRLGGAVADSYGESQGYGHDGAPALFAHGTGEAARLGFSLSNPDHWNAEPDVGRVANGVPARVDRLRGLGNAVVPQVIEWIGRQIVAKE